MPAAEGTAAENTQTDNQPGWQRPKTDPIPSKGEALPHTLRLSMLTPPRPRPTASEKPLPTSLGAEQTQLTRPDPAALARALVEGLRVWFAPFLPCAILFVVRLCLVLCPV